MDHPTAPEQAAIQVVSGEDHDGVITEDVVVGGAGDDGVQAWLVRPSGDRSSANRGAGLVQWHWLDTEAPDGNRSEFLAEARGQAAQGVVSLLPQGRFPWQQPPTGSGPDGEEIEAEVRRFRRLVNVLAARPDVDPSRIGAVGHDFGGMLAAIAAARDPRIACLALIAPTPRWGDWFLPFWPIAEDRIEYLRALRHLDPVEQMAAITPRPLLLQFGKRDFYVALMAGYELRRAANAEGDTVELKAYDAEHDLHVEEARQDRAAFLERVLGISRAA